jgi:hypothetical protein
MQNAVSLDSGGNDEISYETNFKPVLFIPITAMSENGRRLVECRRPDVQKLCGMKCMVGILRENKVPSITNPHCAECLNCFEMEEIEPVVSCSKAGSGLLTAREAIKSYFVKSDDICKSVCGFGCFN